MLSIQDVKEITIKITEEKEKLADPLVLTIDSRQESIYNYWLINQ